MTYATEAERVEARRASRRRAYWGEDRPKKGNYPEKRAPRVDRSKMTEEEWVEHKRKEGREKSARWAERNPGVTSAALRKRRAEYPWYSGLLAAGDRSRQKKHEFTLTAEWAEQTYTGHCSLTGIPFIIAARGPAGKSGLRTYSPSIDRINPLKGYTQDNSRWVLTAVNSFKGTMSDVEMFHIARALLSHVETPR